MAFFTMEFSLSAWNHGDTPNISMEPAVFMEVQRIECEEKKVVRRKVLPATVPAGKKDDLGGY